jgi:hypothetical protein
MCGSFRKPDLTYFPESRLSKEGVEVSQSQSTFVSNDFDEDAVTDQSAGFSLDRPSVERNLTLTRIYPVIPMRKRRSTNSRTGVVASTDIYSTGRVSMHMVSGTILNDVRRTCSLSDFKGLAEWLSVQEGKRERCSESWMPR